jgi:hypothetical protein
MVILDNVMSLIVGVMKGRGAMQRTMPLVLGITYSQIWLDRHRPPR